MLQLLIQLRALQLAAHNAHNLCARIVFFQDHEFFAEVYTFAEDSYDSVIERMLGLGMEQQLNMAQIISEVAKIVATAPSHTKENKDYFVYIQSKIQECNKMIEALCKDPKQSQGTIQMLGDIANEFEVKLYKISRRIK